MATGTNGVATEGEAKSKLGYSGSVDTNKCCTKARAIAMGADGAKLTSYSNEQLVKYSDIQPLPQGESIMYLTANINISGWINVEFLNSSRESIGYGMEIMDEMSVEIDFYPYYVGDAAYMILSPENYENTGQLVVTGSTINYSGLVQWDTEYELTSVSSHTTISII